MANLRVVITLHIHRTEDGGEVPNECIAELTESVEEWAIGFRHRANDHREYVGELIGVEIAD